MSELVAEGIAAAPSAATPLDAVAHALDMIGTEVFTPERREFGAKRRAVIAANPELREREALKGLSLIASMVDALERRGIPELNARVAAELGAVAWSIAHQRWSDGGDDEEFGEVARRTLGEVRAAATRILTAEKLGTPDAIA
jgi:hypothetical protein